MSKVVDTSDISALSEEDLRYAWNAGLLGTSPEAEAEYLEALRQFMGDDGYDRKSAKAIKAEYDKRVGEGRDMAEATSKEEAIEALRADDRARAAEGGTAPSEE